MSKITIPQPHDGFFKHNLPNLTVAKDLLKAYLSPAIVQRLYWDTLKLSNKSFVDEKLAQLHSDVVYTCQIDGQEAYLYALVEQQTKPDSLLPFREKKKNKKQLLIIINLCLYSGKKSPYPYL